jgi:hypothetical protein
MSNHVLSDWEKTEEGNYGTYFRDTLGGRQTLTKRDDGQWELTQEGYLGALHHSIDVDVCMKYANNLSPIENLRIANLPAYEFANSVFYGVAKTIKLLCKSDSDSAEDGLKEIAQLEAYLLILRHRLTERTDHQSTASRAEALSGDALRIITAFYAEMMFGQLDTARNKLEDMAEVITAMKTDLEEEAGDPRHKS